MPRSTARTTAAALLALGGLGVLTACGGGSDTPAAAAGSDAAADLHTANITISAAEGCKADTTTLAAGAVTIKVTNKDATAVSELELLGGERIVGEKENLPPGFSGSFDVSVPAGQYVIYCPGAQPEKTPITVTGSAPTQANTDTAALLTQGTELYSQYVQTQVGYLVQTVTALDTSLKGGDLTAAQNAYKKARPYYEKIEPVAESFTVGGTSLDASLDAREGDVPAAQWTGFHRIEKGLFQDRKLTGLSPYGAKLVTDATKLQTLTKSLKYQPFELANGAQGLLEEVSSGKITGEEERYSHIDLLDFEANVEGAEQAFADLLPGLQKIDPVLAKTISGEFSSLNTLVNKYRSSSDPSGFKLYGELTTADKKALAAAVHAVQEPLSRVASKVTH